MFAKRQVPELIDGLPKTRSALAYAGRLHAGQRREVDGAPFILHPIEVASLLYHAGASDRVIAAGALHDAIEKSDADADDLRKRFGWPIATLVLAVTEDDRLTDYEQRKAALLHQVAQSGADALMVFAADKISKARELPLEIARARQSHKPAGHGRLLRDRKLGHYSRCLRLLEQLLTDSPLVRQLRKELQRLPSVAPGRPLLAARDLPLSHTAAPQAIPG
jgi:hypothetical protein